MGPLNKNRDTYNLRVGRNLKVQPGASADVASSTSERLWLGRELSSVSLGEEGGRPGGRAEVGARLMRTRPGALRSLSVLTMRGSSTAWGNRLSSTLGAFPLKLQAFI